MEERVLLVVDGDDVDIMNIGRGSSIDWSHFRQLAPHLCTMLTKQMHGRNSELSHHVAAVAEAHYFKSIWPAEDAPFDQDTPAYVDEWYGTVDTHRSWGFTSHPLRPVLSPNRDWWQGLAEEHIREFVPRARDTATLLVVGDCRKYMGLCREFAAGSRHWRSFLFTDLLSGPNGWVDDASVGLVDLTRAQTRYPQMLDLLEEDPRLLDSLQLTA